MKRANQLVLWWHHAFLEKRPSVSMGLFRLAAAFTVGCHMIPSFFHMQDNYLPTAFKTKNFFFFPMPILELVEHSPAWVIWSFMWLFLGSLAAFAAGLYSQISCILLMLSCYYFYALNNLHIGTLSFDILLVTMFLLCLTASHGDFLSLDSLRRGKDGLHKRRPYAIQRLLQLQLAWTFWYTALSKVTAGGNWITGNPYLALMNYPPMGVVRDFPLKAWLAQQSGLCYAIGLSVLTMETLIPLLWFIPRTRPAGIAIGIVFQLLLWATLHVPTIFLFLFPPMMLLFIRPEAIVRWFEARQAAQAQRGRAVLLYDGQCGFCVASVKRLRAMDLFGWVDPLDFRAQPDLTALHPALTPERCRSEMILIEPDGKIWGGFQAFQRLSRRLPLLAGAAPLMHLPGAGSVGDRVYRWVAAHRMLLHRTPACSANQCGLPPSSNSWS